MSYLNIPTQNILFGELINYLDIFTEYHKRNPEAKNLLTDYFKQDNIYLGFTDYLDDLGANDEHSYLVNSSTGKSKITDSEYLKYLVMLNPKYAVIPFEYVPPAGGKKKTLRCYKKMKAFFKLINDKSELYKEQNFIIPFYTKQYEFIPKEDLKECLVRSKGMLVITENPEEINYAKLKKYKSILDTYTCDMKIKASTNSPLDILFGIDIGCSHIEINFPFYYSEKGLVTFIDFSAYDKAKSYGKIEEVDKFNVEVCLLNMNSQSYEKDMDIIQKNCECFVCKTGYKKSYIHHLFKCKELNGNILLSIHNCYQARKLYDCYKAMNEEERKNFLMWFITANCCTIKKED